MTAQRRQYLANNISADKVLLALLHLHSAHLRWKAEGQIRQIQEKVAVRTLELRNLAAELAARVPQHAAAISHDFEQQNAKIKLEAARSIQSALIDADKYWSDHWSMIGNFKLKSGDFAQLNSLLNGRFNASELLTKLRSIAVEMNFHVGALWAMPVVRFSNDLAKPSAVGTYHSVRGIEISLDRVIAVQTQSPGQSVAEFLLAVLVHELCHFWAEKFRVDLLTTEDNEFLTDISCHYFGLSGFLEYAYQSGLLGYAQSKELSLARRICGNLREPVTTVGHLRNASKQMCLTDRCLGRKVKLTQGESSLLAVIVQTGSVERSVGFEWRDDPGAVELVEIGHG